MESLRFSNIYRFSWGGGGGRRRRKPVLMLGSSPIICIKGMRSATQSLEIDVQGNNTLILAPSVFSHSNCVPEKSLEDTFL